MRVLFATVGLSLTVCFLPPAPTAMAAEQSAPVTQYDSSITPRSYNLRWIYKEENGKRYKRLYNASTNTWIGDWIYVADAA